MTTAPCTSTHALVWFQEWTDIEMDGKANIISNFLNTF